MSDAPETAPPAAPSVVPVPVPAPPLAAPPATGEPQLGDAGKAALDAERKAKRDAEKRAKDLEDRLKKIEDKDKSELDKAQAKLAELEKAYADAQAQRLRLQVATEHGIAKDDLVLLTATTEDELAAQAKRITELRADTVAATAPKPFAANPGQAAGNATPAQTATVAAGRDLYKKQHSATTA